MWEIIALIRGCVEHAELVRRNAIRRQFEYPATEFYIIPRRLYRRARPERRDASRDAAEREQSEKRDDVPVGNVINCIDLRLPATHDGEGDHAPPGAIRR